VSSLPSIDGTISGVPFQSSLRGTLSGSLPASQSGTISGEPSESTQNSAIAELGGLISSLGSLSAQAQTLPLSVPTLPGTQQPPSYQPQTTDYLGFAENSD
jgi:hypothetical protein